MLLLLLYSAFLTVQGKTLNILNGIAHCPFSAPCGVVPLQFSANIFTWLSNRFSLIDRAK